MVQWGPGLKIECNPAYRTRPKSVRNGLCNCAHREKLARETALNAMYLTNSETPQAAPRGDVQGQGGVACPRRESVISYREAY